MGPERSERRISLNTLLDRGHESMDLDENGMKMALEHTIAKHHRDKADGNIPTDREEPKQPRPHDIRRVRPSEQGLLIIYAIDPDESEWNEPDDLGNRLDVEGPVIGWVISFPVDDDSTPIEYTVNARYADEDDS